MSSTLLDQPLADLLRDMQQELESHMLKEEQILFPMLLGGYARQASAPIAMMRFEHDHHGQALRQMETLTHGLTPPADTWKTMCCSSSSRLSRLAVVGRGYGIGKAPAIRGRGFFLVVYQSCVAGSFCRVGGAQPGWRSNCEICAPRNPPNALRLGHRWWVTAQLN